MHPDNNLTRFSRSLWLTLGTFVAFVFVFAIYVHTEKQIDRANDLRIQSHYLAEELRQSTDDLSRMARAYVITGDPIYKLHYQEILDIRDGKKPRPLEYNNIYWDLVMADDKRPRPNGQKAPLLELMRQAGYTKEEFSKLLLAKANSDLLSSIDLRAMALVESTNPPSPTNRLNASLTLHDARYHQAKAAIMRPISELHQLMDNRTLQAVRTAETTATLVRAVLILFGILLLLMLRRTYQHLHDTLGGSIDELHKNIVRLGSGDFSTSIPVANGMENSVLGWLSATQIELEQLDALRKEAEAKNQRLTQLYAALSQCNQAIVRCSSEAELFPSICSDVVVFGGMQMAWIGLVDEQSKLLKPVASFGKGKEYLEGLRISVDADDPFGQGPSGRAFRTDEPFWCQDFAHDPATSPWHERGIQFGWQASASLPLHRNGKVVGVFNLYGSATNIFDEAARHLLTEMVLDIDFAMNSIEREIQRKRVEEELLKLSQAVDQSTNVIFITDLHARIEYVNAAFIRTSGYSADELIGQTPRLLQSGKTPPSTYQSLWSHLARGESWQGEFINKRKNGEEYIGETNISPLRQSDGKITHYLAIEEDITERKRAEERIQYLANFDVLTGLPNRAQLDDHLKYALSLAKRSNGKLALMFLDIDHFKDINDTLGHKVGDALLVELARRLKQVLREEDTVSRLGGDEFILLLPGTDPSGAAQVAQKMLEVITQPYRIEPYDLTVSASIGIAIYPGDGEDLETLSKNADIAMYRVKQEGRNGHRFFTPEMQARSARNLMLVNALRYALEEQQLHLHYQPQISMQDGRIIGVEALLRWEHPELGAISPVEFIPVAEDSGLILPIGEWVLRTAVRQAKAWIDAGYLPMIIAVNLSAVQFRHADLPEMVSRILDEVGLPPEYLELELTEGVAMHDPEVAVAVMNDLHARGVRMSIDDFGTGYSSLSYLKKFKVYKLKIDQSFVRDIGVDAEDKAIVSAIIHMARSLELQTIAEGVETDAQQAFLREQGCDEAQGYLYSRPMNAEELGALLGA